MKICLAQTKPVKGNFEINIRNHKVFIENAVKEKADVIVFPELSLTGYEPGLAKKLAIDPKDPVLNEFQRISNEEKIIIGVGAPVMYPRGICISMIIFQPGLARQVYSKQYVHEDEKPYFTPGVNDSSIIKSTKIAPAICYEISIPEHSENAYKIGAEVYIASVAKSESGVQNAIKNLSEISKRYSMMVLMTNCIGKCDDFESSGKSSIWNFKGELVGQLDNKNEGILVIETDTGEIITLQ